MLQNVTHAPRSADHILELGARMGEVSISGLKQVHEFMVVDSDRFQQEDCHGFDGGCRPGFVLRSEPDKLKAGYEPVDVLIGLPLEADHVCKAGETRF